MSSSIDNVRLKAFLSEPRFTTYLEHARGDFNRILSLYLWNIDASSAVLATTSLVEVVLRNTVDEALKRWNPRQAYKMVPGRKAAYSEDWILDPCPAVKNWFYSEDNPQQSRVLQNSRVAMKDMYGRDVKLNPTHDDYVAAFTFGTWLRFIPKPSASNPTKFPLNFWEQELCQSFLGQHRNSIFYWGQHLHYARNRASHLEPLLDVKQLQRLIQKSSQPHKTPDPAPEENTRRYKLNGRLNPE
ncbi:hypothetical protein [Rothia terrae]|uniref:hypothetical protein n=1 Tax=Rothia terrae TaxID=396015 RepID=UPI002881C4B4|nr:hypothetical protein [Rothia terrae]MDT0189637.1 hypothetical protein [Rothia terrae]